MAGERNYLRIPPDSTGKRVRLVHGAQISYTGKTNGYTWKLDREDYSFGAGWKFHVHSVYESTITSGLLDVSYSRDELYAGTTPTVGDTILDPDTGAAIATVSAAVDLWNNATNIVGYENPEFGLNVDDTGSANVRFAEGLPQLDAFGKLRTSGVTILGDYVFSDNPLVQDFTQTKWGLGVSGAIDPVRKGLLVTTPGSVTATGLDSQSTAYRFTYTSNTYHHYFPGFSHLIMMTVALNNEGEDGVMREWGYMDDDNGYFFRSSRAPTPGTNELTLEFVIRSSATGSLTETVIGRNETKYYVNGVLSSTTGSIWNGDLVDGTDNSGKNLRLVDDNIYWIDIQWLGAGRVRFGTYHKGQRVVIHEHYNDTNNGFPHSQTGSLPIRINQYCIPGVAVANSASMRVWCAAVSTEANIDLTARGSGDLESFEVEFSYDNINDWKGLSEPVSGKQDRVGVMKTGVTTTGTAMTVPNVTGIKPGFRVHITAQNGGSGVISMDNIVTVLEITNSTTIKLNKAPDVNLTGEETVMFHLNVDHEYHLIGILAPVINRGPQTSVKNRTLYLPKLLQTMAYHKNTGADGFCELEIYVQPIISGNNVAITRARTNSDALLKLVDENNGYGGVMSYENDGRANYFGGGFHNSITFVKGHSESTSLSDQYANFQSGAFKLPADNGGNNRCPVLRVYQSPAAGVPTVIQINTPPTGVNFTRHRENNTSLTFENIPGAIGSDATYGINGKSFYVRHLDLDKLELYQDELFQTPFDTSGLSNVSNTPNAVTDGGYTWNATGGFIISGYGDSLYFAVVAKPIGPSANSTFVSTNGPLVVHFKLTWNEIIQ
jgi:hypothetical protein